jgi:hypothetical protein
LKAIVAALLHERDDLHIEILRLQVELASYKKRYYGPRADQLQSAGDLAQLLLGFAQEMDRKPINPDDVSPHIRGPGAPSNARRLGGPITAPAPT